MANQAITELVIDAGPAERGEARYQAAMERIAAAEQRRIDRQARIDAAMEKGIAVVTQTTTAIDRQARAWEGVVGKIDPVAKATLTAEREMARAVGITTSAVENGLTTRIEAERTLAALRQQQVVKIEEVRAAQLRLVQATDQEVAATNRLVTAQASIHSNSSFHATNLMFQGQDIAMMALSGQAPAMLAMQQGLQVGGIFSQMGSARAIVQGLTTAIGMMLNPLNLATIAIVGFGAAGVQALMGMMNSTEDATKSLEDHKAWLDKILTGYDNAKAAADRYREEAAKLPEGEVKLGLQGDVVSAQERLSAALNRVRNNYAAAALTQQAFSQVAITQGVPAARAQRDAFLEIQQAANQANPDLDRLALLLKTFIANDPSSVLANIAKEMLANVDIAREFADQVGASQRALDNLPSEVEVRINLQMQGYNEAMKSLDDLMPDFRSRFDKDRDDARAALNKAMDKSTDQILRDAAQQKFDSVMAGINRQESEFNASHRTPKTDVEKAEDAYKRLIRTTQQSIGQTQLQAQVLGMTDQQASAFLHTQELLNQAANSNIELTPKQTAELRAYGAAMAQVEVQTAEMVDRYNTGRDATRGFFSDTLNYLRQAAPEWKNFGDVAKSALDAVTQAASNLINKLTDKALSGIADALWNFGWNAFNGGGQTLASGVGDPWAGLRTVGSANGNAFSAAPGLNAYANTIVNRPTLFPFANGIGLMGETGEPGEAIMPLGRNSRGQLGVQVANQNQANDNGGYRSLRVEIYNQGGERVAAKQATMSRQGNVDIARIVVGTVNTAIAEGKMDGAMAAAFGMKRRGH